MTRMPMPPWSLAQLLKHQGIKYATVKLVTSWTLQQRLDAELWALGQVASTPPHIAVLLGIDK